MNEPTKLRVEVVISQGSQGFGSLRFSEEVEIPARDFQALARILSRFHDLFEEIKAAEGRG